MTSIPLPRIGAFVLLSFVIGCTDKGKPEFEHCEQLETQKKYDEAREACQRAVAADPESKSGKLAAARIPVIGTESVKADQADRAARDANDARIADLEAQSAALMSRFDAAVARMNRVQAQLNAATDPADKARLEADLAAATKDKAAVGAEMRGSQKSSNGKPCNCPPGDPLCSCL